MTQKNLLQTHVPVKYAARRQIDLIVFHRRDRCIPLISISSILDFLYGLPIVHTAVIDKDIIRIPGSQLLKIDLCNDFLHPVLP